MTSPAADAPAHLLAFLQRHAVDFELLVPGTPMPTVVAAATALGVSPELILKTLLFAGEDGSYVVAIANGTRRVNPRLLSAASGVPKPRAASPDMVFEVTGFPAGGVAPLGLPQGLTVVVDAKVATLPIAYAGGGQNELLLRIQPADIVRLNRARTARIVDDDGLALNNLVMPTTTQR